MTYATESWVGGRVLGEIHDGASHDRSSSNLAGLSTSEAEQFVQLCLATVLLVQAPPQYSQPNDVSSTSLAPKTGTNHKFGSIVWSDKSVNDKTIVQQTPNRSPEQALVSVTQPFDQQVAACNNLAELRNIYEMSNNKSTEDRQSVPSSRPIPEQIPRSSPEHSRAFYEAYFANYDKLEAGRPLVVQDGTHVKAHARVIMGHVGTVQEAQNRIFRDTTVEGHGFAIMGDVGADAAEGLFPSSRKGDGQVPQSFQPVKPSRADSMPATDSFADRSFRVHTPQMSHVRPARSSTVPPAYDPYFARTPCYGSAVPQQPYHQAPVHAQYYGYPVEPLEYYHATPGPYQQRPYYPQQRLHYFQQQPYYPQQQSVYNQTNYR